MLERTLLFTPDLGRGLVNLFGEKGWSIYAAVAAGRDLDLYRTLQRGLAESLLLHTTYAVFPTVNGMSDPEEILCYARTKGPPTIHCDGRRVPFATFEPQYHSVRIVTCSREMYEDYTAFQRSLRFIEKI